MNERFWQRVAYYTWPDHRPVTKGEIYVNRVRHPSWWPRLLKYWLRREWLWRVQGRPRDIPIVVKTGQLIADSSGRGVLANWFLDMSKMTQAISVDDLWDRLSAHYPVERKP